MKKYTYNDRVWQIVYLQACSIISEDSRDYLAHQAIEMHEDRDKRRKVKRDNLEGFIEDTRRTEIFNGFAGRIFDGRIETNKGKFCIRFLCCTRFNPEWN